MLTICWFILLVLTKGISYITVITKPEINTTLGSNTPIVLNCTYPTEIRVEIIKWKKLVHGVYKYLARFDPSQSDASLAGDGIYLVNRSNLINPKNSSRSAVLIINDVKCEDDGKYQCFVEYGDGVVIKEATSKTTVFLQVSAEQPTSFIHYTSGTLKENDEVILSCSANAGNPDGFVAIWKLNKSNKPLLIDKSTSVHEKTANCTAITNLNITYIVSRNDNGAIFRCSSQNRQTQEPAPFKDTTAIYVHYGPSNITMHSSSSDLDFYSGANVNLTCSSDGNPVPTFKWKFNSSDILNGKRYILTRDNKTLLLMNLNFGDNGIYSCVASTFIDGEIKKVSSDLTLKVRKRDLPINQRTCGEHWCGITESCTEMNGRGVCTTNIWSSLSFLFIFLTIFFVLTTVILCIKQKRDLRSVYIVKFGGHHSRESTGHPQYEVLNAAETTNATGASGTENTRYEVLNSIEQTSILRERNTTNTEYETLKGETSVSRKSDTGNGRYEVLNRIDQANASGNGDTMNARYEVLNMAGESNVYEKIDADDRKYEN